MGNAPSCPPPPPPTVCPVPPPPTVCPAQTVCPTAVYDQTTCKAFISSPKLGINYIPVDENSKNVINEFQNLINTFQPAFCKKTKNAMIDVFNKFIDELSKNKNLQTELSNSQKFKEAIKTEFLSQGLPQNLAIFRELNIEQSVKQHLANIMIISIDNATVDGKISLDKFRKNTIDIINSICPEISSKSTFGETCKSNSFFIFVLLLIIALMAYIFYTNKSVINLPFKRSMFGRRR